MHLPELRQQFAHVLCAAARGRLIRHAAHPLHQIVLEQAMQPHQHAAHRAIAADVIFDALGHRGFDDRQVHRIKNNHRVVFHTQGFGGVNPIAVPAGGAQLGINLGGVVTALT